MLRQSLTRISLPVVRRACSTTSSAASGSASLSFIEKAKVMGANSLLGMFTHRNGYDDKFKGLRVEAIGDGTVTCSIKVEKPLENAYGTLHGGAVATLVDIVGTMAILSREPTKPGVSVDLNVSFLSAARSGTALTIEGRLLKCGKTLAFTEVLLKDEKGAVVATGRHTKAVGGNGASSDVKPPKS